jgi:hypothetical protein
MRRRARKAGFAVPPGRVGASAYPGRVRSPRQIVDYALRRRSLLADVYAGRVGVGEVCDASPYLLRAARFHGEPSEATCPVCRKERLTEVSWVFGEDLKHMSGSARTPEELDQMAAANLPEFSVYVVEVCRTCNWNHLVRSYVLGTPQAPRRGARRRTAGR